MARCEAVADGFGAVQNDGDVFVARRPRFGDDSGAMGFVERREFVAQPIESGAERSAPLLIPTGMSARIAAAIGGPAADAVGTAPGGVFDDFDFVSGRI